MGLCSCSLLYDIPEIATRSALLTLCGSGSDGSASKFRKNKPASKSTPSPPREVPLSGLQACACISGWEGEWGLRSHSQPLRKTPNVHRHRLLCLGLCSSWSRQLACRVWIHRQAMGYLLSTRRRQGAETECETRVLFQSHDLFWLWFQSWMARGVDGRGPGLLFGPDWIWVLGIDVWRFCHKTVPSFCLFLFSTQSDQLSSFNPAQVIFSPTYNLSNYPSIRLRVLWKVCSLI